MARKVFFFGPVTVTPLGPEHATVSGGGYSCGYFAIEGDLA